MRDLYLNTYFCLLKLCMAILFKIAFLSCFFVIGLVRELFVLLWAGGFSFFEAEFFCDFCFVILNIILVWEIA